MIKYLSLLLCACTSTFEVPTNTKGLHHVSVHNIVASDQFAMVEKWKQTAANICGGGNRYHQLTNDDNLIWKAEVSVYPSEEQQVFVDGFFTCK